MALVTKVTVFFCLPSRPLLLKVTFISAFSPGAIGFFDFTGEMNTCIAIRTMVMKDGTVYFQSGAGIVYDSDPIMEYDETVNKAKAINSAIDLAEKGLVE